MKTTSKYDTKGRRKTGPEPNTNPNPEVLRTSIMKAKAEREKLVIVRTDPSNFLSAKPVLDSLDVFRVILPIDPGSNPYDVLQVAETISNTINDMTTVLVLIECTDEQETNHVMYMLRTMEPEVPHYDMETGKAS